MGPGKLFGVLVAAAATAITQTAAFAGTCEDLFANERFTLVVPYKAGGGFDFYARTFAPMFEEKTGATMIVSNIPSAGGITGITKLANSEPEDNMIGFFGTGKVLGDGADHALLPKLQPLNAVAIDVQSWIAKKGSKLEDFIGTEIVGATTSEIVMVTRHYLVGKVLGSTVRSVAGYGGSVETHAAVLRGEVDFTNRTVQASGSDEGSDLDYLFLISDKPKRGLEHIPHLGGPGGIAERISKDKPAEEREETMRLARIAVELNARMRSFYVAKSVQGKRRDCLAAATESIVFDPRFIEAIEATGRFMEPMTLSETNAHLEMLKAAVADNAKLLEELRQYRDD